jgi:multiple antibiotic resistance protein
MDYPFAMNAAANSFLLVYAGLFPIVNPVGSAPIFLALTRHNSIAVRRRLVDRVTINSFILLLGSLFVGSHVLVFFGITLPVVWIAGGLAVASFAWRLLRDGAEPAQGPDKVDETAPVDAFYPLTMPLTVGPGSISVAIALGAQRPQEASNFGDIALLGGGAIAGLAAIALTVFLCYRFADRMAALLGASGVNVLIRLSASILLCIGIQIIWGGYSALLHIPR